jgi:hypothetical protein
MGGMPSLTLSRFEITGFTESREAPEHYPIWMRMALVLPSRHFNQ